MKKYINDKEEENLLPSDYYKNIDPASQGIEPSTDPTDWYGAAQLAKLGAKGAIYAGEKAIPFLEKYGSKALDDAGQLVGNEIGAVGKNVKPPKVTAPGKIATQEEKEILEDLAKDSPMVKDAIKPTNDFAIDDVTKEINPLENDEWVQFMKKNKSSVDDSTSVASKIDDVKLDPNQDLHTFQDGNLGDVIPQSSSKTTVLDPYTKTPPKLVGSVTVPRDEIKFGAKEIQEALDDFKINGITQKNSKILQWIKDNKKTALGAGAASLYGVSKMNGSDSPSEFQIPNAGEKKEIPQPPATKQEKAVTSPEDAALKALKDENEANKKEIAELKAAASSPKTSKSFVNELLKAEGTSLGSDANLKEAQQKRSGDRALNMFGRAADTLSGALLHTGNKLDKFYDEQDKFAEHHVSDIKDRIANEKNDPGSSVSDAYRKILGEFGVKVEGPISAAAVEKIAPWVEKKYLAEETRKARIEELKVRQSAIDSNKETIKSEKQKKVNSDKTASYRREIDRTTKPLQDTYDNRDQIVKFLEDAIKNPTGGGFQDTAITYGFIKSRDNSAVKEGEVKMLGAAGSIPDRLRRSFSKAISGQSYNAQDMKDLIAVIRNENSKLKDSYSNRVKSVLKQAEKEGLDLTEVNPRNDMYSPLITNDAQPKQKSINSKSVSGGKKVVSAQYSKQANKSKLMYSDGSQEIVDGDVRGSK